MRQNGSRYATNARNFQIHTPLALVNYKAHYNSPEKRNKKSTLASNSAQQDKVILKWQHKKYQTKTKF